VGFKTIDLFSNNKTSNLDKFHKFNETSDLPPRLLAYQAESTATKLINWVQYTTWIDGGPDPLI
jgi:hypothetical protein